MNIVDIIIIGVILIGALMGFKRGAIKGIVSLVGIITIAIISYQIRGFLGNLAIKYMPFIDYGGKLSGLVSLNVLLYQGISFLITFVLLYCVLNIIVNLSGLVDMLVKMTVILEIPSKIIGAILGALESCILVFLACFALFQFGHTKEYVDNSKIATAITTKTPIVNVIFAPTIASVINIYDEVIPNNVIPEGATEQQVIELRQKLNTDIIQRLLSYGVVNNDVIKDAIAANKMGVSANAVIMTIG